MTVHLQDRNNIPELMRTLRRMKGKDIQVGVHEGDSEMSMIAAVHEYGEPKLNIPERSFIRSGFDEHVDKVQEKIVELMPAVIHNNVDPDVFLDAIGMEFASLIKKKLIDLQDPPNSEKTIKIKGSSNPLIDTGRLRDSIVHKVK
ncbi:hypothetical protein [Sporosarcina sp. FSL K6-1508]|uniref:hypothetical protein n=1 Tax=Sporosarcina sp. FSL K6-1508 TaxID=2921553 RepID=UPI0030F92EDF